METRHVRVVVAVSRCGSFTAAARELYMAQSTLSRQVASLERDLGARLFVRGPRSVELTAQGAAFLSHAQDLLTAVERAESAAREAGVDAGRAPVSR